ncbi:MAG: hypothetical protein AAFR04_12515, partial [Pseudomonadota bacterium]
SVAFSPDGRRVVSGGWDNTVRIWDAATARALQVLKGHESTVWSVAFSPDGRRVVSQDRGETRAWDAASGKPLTVTAADRRLIRSVDSGKATSGSFSVKAGSPPLIVRRGKAVHRILQPLPGDNWIVVGADGRTFTASPGASAHLRLTRITPAGPVSEPVSDAYLKRFFRPDGLRPTD